MIVTTSSRANEQLILIAQEIAIELAGTYKRRNKQAIEELKRVYLEDILVVGKNRLELHVLHHNSPFFFHPNSAMFRIKRLLKGETEPFIDVCNLQEGDSFLDCTLGLASDSIIASFLVGNSGFVRGIEGSQNLAYIVKKGLHQWNTGLTELDEAMARIDVVADDHLTYLVNCPDKSYDVLYFDPMFEESVDSIGLKPLKTIAKYSSLSDEAIIEAKRVARNRIILKDHFKSNRFNKHGFTVIKRKSAKFHYGVIEIQ